MTATSVQKNVSMEIVVEDTPSFNFDAYSRRAKWRFPNGSVVELTVRKEYAHLVWWGEGGNVLSGNHFEGPAVGQLASLLVVALGCNAIDLEGQLRAMGVNGGKQEAAPAERVKTVEQTSDDLGLLVVNIGGADHLVSTKLRAVFTEGLLRTHTHIRRVVVDEDDVNRFEGRLPEHATGWVGWDSVFDFLEWPAKKEAVERSLQASGRADIDDHVILKAPGYPYRMRGPGMDWTAYGDLNEAMSVMRRQSKEWQERKAGKPVRDGREAADLQMRRLEAARQAFAAYDFNGEWEVVKGFALDGDVARQTYFLVGSDEWCGPAHTHEFVARFGPGSDEVADAYVVQ